MNKAEKFVKRIADVYNVPDDEGAFDVRYIAVKAISEKLNLDSGWADIPDKRIPPEYIAALNRFAPFVPKE